MVADEGDPPNQLCRWFAGGYRLEAHKLLPRCEIIPYGCCLNGGLEQSVANFQVQQRAQISGIKMIPTKRLRDYAEVAKAERHA